MATQKSRITVKRLQEGMYVCELDRPWCQTPFPLQGFYINSVEDIRAVSSFCEYVYIDVPLSKGTYDELVSPTSRIRNKPEKTSQVYPVSAEIYPSKKQTEKKEELTYRVTPIRIKSPIKHKTKTPIGRAVKKADKLLNRAYKDMEEVYHQISEGWTPDMEATKKIARSMTESVVANPDALLWLTRLQEKDHHSYQHAVSASVWGLVVARYMGLETHVLEALATGLLLSQIGKAQLPQELLSKERLLNADDFEKYQSYVSRGVELLRSEIGVSEQVISVVEYHKERHNGSGFPKGVTGDRIPLLGKIAGLVDRFQELIQPYPGAEPLSPTQAVSLLFQGANIEFQADLLERFVSAVGIYPTGSIVELTNQQVGVVVKSNTERKLWPTIMLLKGVGQNKMGKVINLKEYNESQNCESKYLQITRTLPQSDFNINLGGLAAVAGIGWSLRGH